MSDIKNIVIYRSIVNGKPVEKSCIFFNDGGVFEGDREDAINTIKDIAKERQLSATDIKELMNKETFYVMTEEEFKERYDSFIPRKKSSLEFFEERYQPIIEDDDEKEEVVYEENYDGKDSYITDEEEKQSIYTEFNSTEENKNSGCFKAAAVGITAFVIGAVGCLYGLSRCDRKSKVGSITPVAISTTATKDNTTTETTVVTNTNEKTDANNNDFYNSYKLSDLLNVTKNEFQKESMIDLNTTLNGFNGTFADNYVETGHDIKAALTVDEMAALQNAYNKYSKEEIKAYFNGTEVDANKLSSAYKSASLQLMGAYIIETKEHPVDVSGLMDDQAGVDYYKYYHNLFLSAKEATGEEQKKLVKEFFTNVRNDFPVTKKVRTEGISHSEYYDLVKDYQLSVTPMIAAAEMLFQNLGKDYTLNNSEINFINDIGLCNHADDKFKRIETIMLGASEDKTNPTYEQYKYAIIDELVSKDRYFKSDEQRELSNLRRFQEIVNGDALWKHRNAEEKARSNGENNSNNNKNTTTRTYTKTTTTKKTTTTTKDGGPIPEDKKTEIDKKTEEENKKAKEEAEKKAKEEAKRQQEEENKKKKAIEESIAKENEKKKKEAEEKAKKDKNVKNVTTDGSGSNKDLPDPNEYGKDFDSRVKVKTK